MSDGIVRKQDFAAMTGVTPGRVSQWITERKIHGDAIVGRGCRAQVRVSVALEQLKKNLDIDQRLGMNAKARLDPQKPATSARKASPGPAAVAMAPGEASDTQGEAPETLEDRIKLQRLAQLALGNAKASQEAAARSGRYVKAADARQQMGRIAARLMTTFEASLTEMANAIIAAPPTSPRDALRLLRSTWRNIRERYAGKLGAAADALPPLVDDEGESTGATPCER